VRELDAGAALTDVGLQHHGQPDTLRERARACGALVCRLGGGEEVAGQHELGRAAEAAQDLALALAREAAARNAGIHGRRQQQAPVSEREAADPDCDRRIEEPERPELPARQAPPARHQKASAAVGERGGGNPEHGDERERARCE